MKTHVPVTTNQEWFNLGSIPALSDEDLHERRKIWGGHVLGKSSKVKISGCWLSLPLWNIWLRQLGWWTSQLNGKIIQSCSSHHQPDLICWGYHLSKIRDFDRISRIRSIFCCISWLGSHMYESLVWGTRNSIFLSKSPRTLNFPWFSHVFPWFSFFVSPWFLLHFFWIYSDWAEQHHWAWSHPNSMCHAASTLGSVPSLDQRQLRS